MKRKFNILALSLLLLNVSIVYGQQKKDSSIFLGDTVKIVNNDYEKLSSKEKQLLTPLNNKEGYYIAFNEGEFSTTTINYKIYNHLKDGVTKVLVIGNSFSDDGVESYLHDMARSTGKPLVIGNLFRGGAPLDFHLKNATTNNKIYSYRKTSIDGIKSNTDKTSILEALKDENWDFICFQQASVTSGNWASVEESLPKLYEYVNQNYPISAVKYLYHQTWAYAQNSVTGNFDKYDRNQMKMFDQILSVSKGIGELIPVYKIIPTGTAIQNGRTTYLGDNFTREGYHLDLVFGRYTAASTWYQTLFSDLNKVNYIPSYLSADQIALAKEAADLAVRNPFAVSQMVNYENQKSHHIDFDKIKINFGSDIIIPGWLSLLFEREGSARHDILDNNNKQTAVNIKILRSFDSRGSNGPKKVSFASEIPGQVAQFYHKAVIDQSNQNLPFLRIENLNPNKKYDLSIVSTVAENFEEAIFNVHADKNYNNVVNPSFNRDKEILFKNLKPTKTGTIDISFSLPNGKKQSISLINALIIKQLN